MSKFGGVDNYIVATWNPEDLDNCLDLNLPCVDVSPLLQHLNIGRGREVVALYGSEEYIKITWVKPLIVHDLLKRGYAVHTSGKSEKRPLLPIL